MAGPEYPCGEINKTPRPSEESEREKMVIEGIRKMAKPEAILDIAKEIQQFIDSKGWSWCDMDRVYRILKTVNG